MRRLLKSLLAVGLMAGLSGFAGFLVFATRVSGLEPVGVPKADAIVVLTGDEERISTGMQLMESGHAARLLISGVYHATRMPTELKRHIRGSEALVRCCVDIGHEALNTSGNAEEASQWARRHGYSSLIVVTSNYHLPRSLVEFQRTMPHIRLVGHPVRSGRQLRFDRWWTHRPTVRLLLAEYVKLLGSSARFVAARLLDGPPAAGSPNPGAPREPDSPARTVGAMQ